MRHIELVGIIVDKTGVARSVVTDVLDAYHNAVMDTVSKGDKVDRRGFGTFAGVVRKAKKGRAVKSNQEVSIPERIRPKFKPGKDFIKVIDDRNKVN